MSAPQVVVEASPRLPAPRSVIHLLYWHLPRLLGARLSQAFVVACIGLPVAWPSWPALLALTALASYFGFRGIRPQSPFVRTVIGGEQAPLFLLGAALAPALAWGLDGSDLLARLRAGDFSVWALQALWAFNLAVFGWSSSFVVGTRSLLRRALMARGLAIEGSALAQPLPMWLWPAVVFPWNALVSPRVKRARGLVFARVDGVELKCDVYQPEVVTDATPILLLLHGGGWVLGNLEVYFPTLVAMRLAQQGCLVVTSEYRLAPETPFPGQLLDCKRAIAWIRGPDFPFGGDKARLLVGGESAGGNVALLAALTGNAPELQPPESPDADTRVAACVDLFGIHSVADVDYMSPDRIKGHWKFCEEWFIQAPHRPEDPVAMAAYDAASPTRRVRQLATQPAKAAVPPILTLHGTKDVTVPFHDAELFHEALARLRQVQPVSGPVPDAFVPLPGTGHAFCMWPSIRSLAVADAIACFIGHVARAR